LRIADLNEIEIRELKSESPDANSATLTPRFRRLKFRPGRIAHPPIRNPKSAFRNLRAPCYTPRVGRARSCNHAAGAFVLKLLRVKRVKIAAGVARERGAAAAGGAAQNE
jgi:hypothetical protein